MTRTTTQLMTTTHKRMTVSKLTRMNMTQHPMFYKMTTIRNILFNMTQQSKHSAIIQITDHESYAKHVEYLVTPQRNASVVALPFYHAMSKDVSPPIIRNMVTPQRKIRLHKQTINIYFQHQILNYHKIHLT